MRQVAGERHAAYGGESADESRQPAAFDDQHNRRRVSHCDQETADIVGQHADMQEENPVPVVGPAQPGARDLGRQTEADEHQSSNAPAVEQQSLELSVQHFRRAVGDDIEVAAPIGFDVLAHRRVYRRQHAPKPRPAVLHPGELFCNAE